MKSFSDHKRGDIARFSVLATLLVVICHTDDFFPVEWKTSVVRWLGGTFSDANVSNFFFLSGFLLAVHYGEDRWWITAIRKRSRSLVIPYMAWNAILFAVFYLAGHVHGECGIGRVFGLGFNRLPFNFVLWYVKTLVYFILLSPGFFFIASRTFLYVPACAILLVVQCFGARFIPGFSGMLRYSFPIVGLTVFITGGYCRIHNLSFSSRLSRLPLVVPVATWMILSWLVFCSQGRIPELLVLNEISGVFFLIWIASAAKWNIENPFFRRLSSCTFFIYAYHRTVLYAISKITLKSNFVGNLENNILQSVGSVAIFTFLFSVSTLFCVATAAILHRISPRLSSILSGGRMK